MKAIEVEGLYKSFGDIKAVDGVTFQIEEGEVFGLLGPNGAGKTTIIRILTGLILPNKGACRVGGFDCLKEASRIRNIIGVVPQASTADLDLTGWENMDLYGRFYEIPSKERKKRVNDLLDRVGLADRTKDLVATYSGGMRRRLEIARGLIHKPSILFLDEPTIGLDPQSRIAVCDLLEQFKKDNNLTIILTTHYMEEAETLATEVAIIDYGKVLCLDTPQALKHRIPEKDILEVRLSSLPTESLDENLKTLPYVDKVLIEGVNLRIYVEEGAKNLPAVLEEIKRMGEKVASVTLKELTLEDVFIHFTGRSIREEEIKKIGFFDMGAPRILR